MFPVTGLAHAHIVEQGLCTPVDRPWPNSCGAMQELKQSNASYQLEYSIIMVRRQLARAAGVLPEDETALLRSQIAELSSRLEQLISEGAHMARSLKEGSLQLGESYRLLQLRNAGTSIPPMRSGTLEASHPPAPCTVLSALLQISQQTALWPQCRQRDKDNLRAPGSHVLG